jgi:hypothetical protein
MISVHLFNENFGDNHVFLSSYWSKTIEKKGREMIKTTYEYERENYLKVVTK